MKTILTTTYSPRIQGSYGIVCREIFSRIFPKKKYKIVSHSWFDISPTENVSWKVIPTMNHEQDKFGEQSFARVLREVKPDIVWALGDFYMLKHVFAEKKNFPTIKFICHLAVDGEPWHQGMLEFVSSADNLVALSSYGSEVLTNLTGKQVDYIYHGVDIDRYHPVDDHHKHQMRLAMSNGVLKDDSFVIGWVGKDQYRKQNWKFWELLHYLIYGDYIICNTCKKVTLKEFDKQLGIPRDVGKLRMYRSDYDYSHCYYCNSQDITSGIPRPYIYGWSHMPFRPDDGWNPNQLGDIWKIRESVYQTANLTANTGVPTERMIDIYSVMDLFYCMSGGEGFGLPVAEAMACEIPVAYSNYSAHADIARGVGIEVETDFTCEMNSCFDRAQIKTADAIAKILPYIENRALLKELGVKARKKITTLNWDTIALQWENYIDNVAKNIKHTSGVIV